MGRRNKCFSPSTETRAHNAEQAARKAWQAMRADGSVANCFTVIDRAGTATGIDMGLEPPAK